MTDLIHTQRVEERPDAGLLALPEADVTIRPGLMEDVAWIDVCQKKHTDQVGFLHMGTLEGKIKAGHVLVAEIRQGAGSKELGVGDKTCSALNPNSQLPPPSGTPVGYLIGNDQYFKRDDVGVIYQLFVEPGRQRGYVGAALLKAQFERSAYGCRLYCCWCAQDIAANRFWEAMGFTALAFRAGSERKRRVHIFWQKRIRMGDAGDVGSGGTPWWFPSKTGGGALREDRIVLPIPPGTHWSDAKPLIFPEEVKEPAKIEEKAVRAPRQKKDKKKEKAVEVAPPVRRNGLMFDIPKQGEALPEEVKAQAKQAQAEARKAQRKVKRACDPRLVSAARELRDRWVEQVNAGLYVPDASGKYEVGRVVDVGRGEGLAGIGFGEAPGSEKRVRRVEAA